MDLQLSSFPILSGIILFILMVLVLKMVMRPKPTSNLPPGPWKVPFIGNLHQLVLKQPHRALLDLAKKHGPLMHLQFGEVPTFVVSSPEYAKEVMKTHDITFASRPLLNAMKVMTYGHTDIVFAPYGEYWRQLRKICTLELLSMKRVQSFRPIREQEMSNFIEWIGMNAGSSVNLTEKLYTSTYALVSNVAFGRTCDEHEEFISYAEEAMKRGTGFDIVDMFPSLKLLHWIIGESTRTERLHKRGDMILENIINQHIKESKTRKGDDEDEDLVDVLLKFHEEGDFPLTINNIKSVIQDMFVAGGETSATTVDWAMREMIKNPIVMKKAQAEVRHVFDSRGRVDETGIPELKYLKFILKETLRIHPPLPFLLPRENSERCQINGYEIPAKTKVIVNAWAILRDPEYWTEPERFYPERFINSSVDYKGTSFEYIPFGAGRRLCPDMTFGLANVELSLSQLLYYFDWNLPGGMKHQDLNMTENFGVTMRARDDLHLVPTPYHSLSSC
ncbi:cytochrome P450 71D11-like [Tripterygium wilfordii]|uniref:cytochrome P450 71D11-like n=1 Tax=Tripterygium wilfordii TaxID=458696 RepID=UPI0018F83544|nr:cytochrome P450 71D11-like [Tripterygium wilfordii]XP_038690093.1 cytochrome P450 71D11-like [Tripterygium wilfordii]